MPAGPRTFEPREAGEVLAQIEHEHARLRLGDLHRRQLAGLLLGNARERLEFGRNRIGHGHRPPIARAYPGRGPTGDLLGGVVGFAGQNAGLDVRSEGGLPRAVGGDGLHRAVGQLDFELGQQPRPVAIVKPIRGAVVPTAGQHAADGVPAVRPDQVGHVVGLVVDPLLVVGPAGREVVVAHRLAVDPETVEAQRTAVDRGPADRAWNVKLLAQQRAGQGGIVGAGHGDRAPRPFAHLGDRRRGRPMRVVEIRGVPVRLGRGRNLPRGIDRTSKRLVVVELDHQFAGQHGRRRQRAGDGHREDILSRHQVPRDIEHVGAFRVLSAPNRAVGFPLTNTS